MKKRILSLFLAVVMLVLAIPAMALTAFAADAEAVYSTSFSESDIPASLAGSYAAGDTVTLKKGWEIGVMAPDVWNKNYDAADYAMSNYVASGTGGGFQTWGSGGYYDGTIDSRFGGRCLIFAAPHEGSVNAEGNRAITSVTYNVLVRYTAEYTGKITIDVSKLNFRLAWNCAFVILLNGNPIGQFDTEDFVYGAAGTDLTFNPADNGWFQAGTTADVASQITAITGVDVKYGDTIDFVFASTRQDSPSADYAYSRMAAQTYDFDITYTEMLGNAKPTVSTTFSLDSNLPVYKNEDGSPITGDFDFKGGWSFGSLALNTVNPASVDAISLGTTLTPYSGNNSHSVSSGTLYYSNKANGWNESSASTKNGGAIMFLNGNQILMAPGVAMNVKGENGGYPRSIGSYGAAATIRYTAQYGGDVTVSIKGNWLYEYTQGYAHIFVLKNGTKIQDIIQTADAVDVTITDTLIKGDTLDFVAVMDPTYKVENNDDGKGAFRIEAANRTFLVDALTVEYENVVTFGTSTVDATKTDVTTGSYTYQSEELRFFQWYDANGNEINAGEQLSTGCYAKLNPEMKAAVGITDGMTFSAALSAYYEFLKTALNVAAPTNWQIGTSPASYAFTEIKYPAFLSSKNLGFVTSDGKVGYADNTYFVNEATFDSINANALTKLNNTGLMADSSTAGSAKLNYGDALKTTVAYDALGSYKLQSAPAYQNQPYVTRAQGGSSYGYVVYRYTAPKSGVVSFSIDAFTYWRDDGNSCNAVDCFIAVNGALQSSANFKIGKTQTLAQYQAQIAAMTFEVEAGDTIDFCYSQGTDGTSARCMSPVISASMAEEFEAKEHDFSANIIMDENYALNVFAKPHTAGNAVSAMVDGKVVAGALQADGSYKMQVAADIDLTDLTTYVVTFHLQENVDGHVITEPVAYLSAEELLEKYENDANPLVADLAKDLHYLAIATNYLWDNSNPQPTADQYNHMARNNETLQSLPIDATYTGEEGVYKIVGANVNLGDRLSLVLLITSTNGSDIMALKEGYELYAYNNGATLTATANEFACVTVGGTDYIGVIVDIPVAAYGEMMNFVVREAETSTEVSSTLQYGLNTWCAKVEQKIAGYSSQKYIARGVYNLGLSAAAYKASL